MKVRFIAPRAGGPVSTRAGMTDRWTGGSAPGRAVFPPFALAVLAGLTPPDWDVEVVDESVEPHDPNSPGLRALSGGSRSGHVGKAKPDLVAVTSITATARRAYEIAAVYARNGVKVVLGGMHASALPDEALRYADAVVVGEAEPVWADVLADCSRGRLRRIYRSSERPSLAGLPEPRRDLFDPRRYVAVNLVQASRGCPNNCSFCAVTRFFGATHRTRPVEEVAAEVRRLTAANRGPVLFVDDNIVGNKAYARALFNALVPLRIKWAGQSSLAIASDPGLLDLAARSGCLGLFIGFESLADDNLRQINKGLVNRVERYAEAVREIHRRGIAIEGAFIFGLDGDDASVFARTVRFARAARLALAQFGVLTPFPGTPLYEQLKAQGRILDGDWSHYTIAKAVFQPLRLSREALEEGLWKAYRQFYSYRSMLGRLVPLSFGAPFARGWWRRLALYWTLNMYFRRYTLRPARPAMGQA